MRTILLALALPVGLGALVACSNTFIPNTDVEDSSPNRKVIAFCEEYRHAMEDRNVAKLVAMASPRYHDDHGTPKGDDDTDYETLPVELKDKLLKTTSIRYEIRYQKVIFTENNHVLVNFRYSASFRTPTKENDRGEWHHKVDDNQLDLVPDGEGYKILAGM